MKLQCALSILRFVLLAECSATDINEDAICSKLFDASRDGHLEIVEQLTKTLIENKNIVGERLNGM